MLARTLLTRHPGNMSFAGRGVKVRPRRDLPYRLLLFDPTMFAIVSQYVFLSNFRFEGVWCYIHLRFCLRAESTNLFNINLQQNRFLVSSLFDKLDQRDAVLLAVVCQLHQNNFEIFYELPEMLLVRLF